MLARRTPERENGPVTVDVLPPYLDSRSVKVERRWLPLPGREGRLVVLDRELVAAGVGWQVRGGIKEWLTVKARTGSDPAEGKTRARYRRLLANLPDVDPDVDDGGTAPAHASRGGGGTLAAAAEAALRGIIEAVEVGMALIGGLDQELQAA